MEPLIIAIHNTLQKSNHKVYTFVKPMTKDTLFLNVSFSVFVHRQRCALGSATAPLNDERWGATPPVLVSTSLGS
jgi:hypothetical protein